MQHNVSDFQGRVNIAVKDLDLRRKVQKATGTSLDTRKHVVDEISGWEELRQRAHDIKKEVIDRLDEYLIKFEEAARANGCIVHHAPDSSEANLIIADIVRRSSANRVVKSKSMVTEEMRLNDELQKHGVRIIETDLGEYIVQLAGETPSHITAPALHKSKEDIGKLFADTFGIPFTDDPGKLTAIARERLRDDFLNARVGISGVNFVCADTGTLVIVENEGNVRLCTLLPDVHVAVMSVEKIIPSIKDLPLFLKLLTRSATGQRATSYVSLINGPRSASTHDGPTQLHIVILDGGRKQIAKHPGWKESLYCIRCGACMNVCPVYQTIGGHAYGSVYPGPIGSVISPLLFGMEGAKGLPYASSLCGACTDICPVKIDLHHHLFWERREIVAEGMKSFGEKLMMNAWRWVMLSPGRIDTVGRFGWLVQKIFGKRFPVPGWTPGRKFPAIAGKSFRMLMKDRAKLG
jgi:L-lactate dehydrogenase complex protein LldF